MNGLAYSDYIDKPHCIFNGWHASQMYRALTRAVNDAGPGRADRPLDDITIARLKWYPALTSDFIVAGQLKLPDIEKILADPSPRFWALANHYEELAALLEPKLMEDPESAERLYRWTHYRDFTRFHKDTEYLARLGDDPNRHYRLTPPTERSATEKLALESDKNRSRNAAWAFLYVSTHQLTTLESDLTKRLLESEEYSYLAATVLRRRGLPLETWFPLVAGIKSPRWAYHAMRYLEPGANLPIAAKNGLQKIIYASPPWAVQLWEARNWTGDQLQWAYEKCLNASSAHECAPELRSWYRMRTAIVSRPLVASSK